MTKARLLVWLAMIAPALGCASSCSRKRPAGVPAPTGLSHESLEDGGITYRYAVHVPRGYDPARAWPVVVFLHGRGESGTDGTRHVTQGVGAAVLRVVEAWPVIAIFPQRPTLHSEWEQHEPAVMAMLARAASRHHVDLDRLYLAGLSRGGHGVWVLGAHHPETWAALVPVCGYVSAGREVAPGLPPPFNGTPAELAPALSRVPIWAFHGAADEVVSPQETRDMVAAIEAAGGAPRMTILPGVGHDAGDPAFRDGGLRDWLLAQRRPAGRRR